MADPLASDPALDGLVESLLLAERFELHILTCDGPRAGRAAFEHITGRLLDAGVRRAARIEGPAPSVLDALAKTTPGSIVFVDASEAPAEDEPDWRRLFRRLNRRRNEVAARLEAPLVLCLTPALEVALSQEAPDVWSIRGRQATVSLLPAEPGGGLGGKTRPAAQ